jgi:hypothetical protein
MIVEKVQDTAGDGIPRGTMLLWHGEWARSPEDCLARERDPMPVLYYPGGRPAPPTYASDWIEVTTERFLEHDHWARMGKEFSRPPLYRMDLAHLWNDRVFQLLVPYLELEEPED